MYICIANFMYHEIFDVPQEVTKVNVEEVS